MHKGKAAGLWAAVLCGMVLSACGGKAPAETTAAPAETKAAPTKAGKAPAETPSGPEKKEKKSASAMNKKADTLPEARPLRDAKADPAARAAFSDLLFKVIRENRLAYRGETRDNLLDTYMGSLASNSFALLDVDGDGSEELLLTVTGAVMANQGTYVFSHDDGARLPELEYVSFMPAFYDDGTAVSILSHNHGLAPGLEGFWPYTVSAWQADQDIYDTVYEVDAWQKEYSESNYEGEHFPDETDEDGNGVVYMLYEGGYGGKVHYLDDEAYRLWNRRLSESKNRLEPRMRTLSEENAEAIRKGE